MADWPTIPAGAGYPLVNASTGEFLSTAVNEALNATIDAAIEAATDGIAQTVYTTQPWSASTPNIRPLVADTTRISSFGSSTVANMTADIEAAMAALDWSVDYFNQAWSGERYAHTLARTGIAPALLTFPSNTIPASGAVTVTTTMPTTYNFRSTRGTVAGVLGSLSLSGGVYTFTRVSTGDAVALEGPTAFVPSLTRADSTPETVTFRDTVAILDLGKNDEDDEGAPARINAALDLLHSWLVPAAKNVLVMGHFVNTGASARHKANVAAVNADRAAKYGDRFIDLQTYITGSDVWDHTGITPTSTDLAQQAAGEKPSSLSTDAAHLNTAAETAIVNHLVMPVLAEALGLSVSPVITSDGFSGDGALNARNTDIALGGVAMAWNSNSTWTTSGGQLISATGTGTGIANLTTPSQDVELSAVLPSLPTAQPLSIAVRLVSRGGTIADSAYRVRVASDGGVTLQRRFGSADATISTGTHTASPGDRVGVRAVGSQISIVINDAVVETVTDTNIPSGTYVAFIKTSDGIVLDDAILTRVLT